MSSSIDRGGLEALITHLFKEGHKYTTICFYIEKYFHIKISLPSLMRILKGLKLKRYKMGVSVNSPDLIDAVKKVQRVTENRAGYRRTWFHIFRDYHIRSTQETVRHCLLNLNLTDVRNRCKKKLIRRSYFSGGPNHVWHLDGLDKLKPYGFPIHACIDGFSRKIMWIHCSTSNNDPRVILHHFLSTIISVGRCSTILRSDRGTETILAAAAQRALRDCPRSHIFGPSYLNQRVESFWSFLRSGWTQIWIDLFSDLMEYGVYDPNDKIQKCIAEHCFMPVIQNELAWYQDYWNNHTIRRTRTSGCPGGRPVELYEVPECFGFSDCGKIFNLEEAQLLLASKAKEPESFTDPGIAELCKDVLQNRGIAKPGTREEATAAYFTIHEEAYPSNAV